MGSTRVAPALTRRPAWWRGRGLVAVVATLATVVSLAFGLVAPQRAAAAIGGAELAPGAVDQNSGAFATSIPIEVPSFHGLEPKLALTYSSSGDNGLFGVGWQLTGASTIERKNWPRGVPETGTQGSFVLDGQQMSSVPLSGANFVANYVTTRQGFEPITFSGSSTNLSFSVMEKDGTIKTYAKRLDIAGTTVRWMLSSVKDPHGNTVTYGYACDTAPECYLSTISYSGTVVSLYREARPDPILTGVGGGFTKMNDRVKTIDVKVSGSRARTYKLNYSVSATTGRSLLSSVRRFGSDATLDATNTVSGGSAVPAVSFTYQADTKTFTKDAVFAGWCAGGQFGLADFDGDGRADLWCHKPSSSTTWVALGNGAGGFTGKAGFAGWCGTGGAFGTADFNGDGKADLWCHATSAGSTWVAFGNGSGGFTQSMTLAGWCSDYKVTTVPGVFGVADVTGDGKADVYCRDSLDGGVGTIYVQVSNGANGWTNLGKLGDPYRGIGYCGEPDTLYTADVNGNGRADFWCQGVNYPQPNMPNNYMWILPTDGGQSAWLNNSWSWNNSTACPYPTSTGAADFNGDGLDDFYCRDNTATSAVVGLSNGSDSFRTAGTLSPWCAGSALFGTGDFNGDGKSDFWCHDPSTAATWVSTSNAAASGFTASSMTMSSWCGSGAAFGTGDFNGDGKADFWCHDPSAGNTWVATPGQTGQADVLTKVTNELGGSTTVTYTLSSAWPQGTLGAGLKPAPGNLSTVSRVQVCDGQGLCTDTQYAYNAGRWDPREQRFLGFGQVTATDSSGANSVTSFRTVANYESNRISQVDRLSSTGTLLERSTISYTEQAISPPYGAYYSTVASRTHAHCQGAAACQTTRTDFVYDIYGNITEQDDYGDTAVSGDERTTVTTYTLDTPYVYLVNTPLSVTVYAGIGPTGTQLQHTETDYNSAGDATAKRTWLDTTNANISASATYDPYGNRTSSTNELGQTTSYTYEPTYHLYQDRVCNGMTSCSATACTTGTLCSTHTWNALYGMPASFTDVNGGVTSWQYDVFGRVTKETHPDASTTSTSYVNWGTPGTQYVQTSVSDGTADGLWHRVYPDGLGRTIKTVDEPDRTVLTVYDAQGNVSKVSNQYVGTATPVYTTYGYDGLGRQISVTHPDNSSTTTTYGVNQNSADADFATARLTATRCDEMGVCRRVAYDGNGSPVVTSEWDGVGTGSTLPEYRTHAEYDLLGRITKVTDSAGNTSTATWDSLGRKTAASDPDAGSWSYGFDAAGHLTSQTNGNGQVLTFQYADQQGRLTSAKSGTTTLATYTYDQSTGHGAGLGQLTSMSDTSGSTSYTYDSLGRVTTLGKTIGTRSYTVGQSFDTAGRRASLTYPGGEVVTYTYDASGCLTGVGGYLTAATCTPTTTSQTLGNGVVLTQSLDVNRGWQNSDTAVLGATTLQSESYTHQADGKITAKTSDDTADQWSYGYDSLGRLTSATNTTNPGYTSAYTYDQAGRMLTGTAGTLAYPTVGTGHAHAPSTVAGAAYTYDNAGNLTSGGGTSYVYDTQNRLASTTRGAATTTYNYDGFGGRVTAGTVDYVELDGQLLYQYDNSTAKGTSFYYDGGERIASKTTGGTAQYYVADALGSPHLVLNSTGAVTRTSIYSPYGTVLSQSGTASDPYGLAGDYLDAASGLYKRGARYQAPAVGAFSTPDTSGHIDPTAPQSLNRYAYAGGDPVNYTDHTGQVPLSLGKAKVTAEADPTQAGGSLNLDVAGFTLSGGVNPVTGTKSGSIAVPIGEYGLVRFKIYVKVTLDMENNFKSLAFGPGGAVGTSDRGFGSRMMLTFLRDPEGNVDSQLVLYGTSSTAKGGLSTVQEITHVDLGRLGTVRKDVSTGDPLPTLTPADTGHNRWAPPSDDEGATSAPHDWSTEPLVLPTPSASSGQATGGHVYISDSRGSWIDGVCTSCSMGLRSAGVYYSAPLIGFNPSLPWTTSTTQIPEGEVTVGAIEY